MHTSSTPCTSTGPVARPFTHILVLGLGLSAACAPKPPPVADAAPPPAPVQLPEYALAVLGDMDRTVNPCEDFYAYACGGWEKKTPLPADKPSWTRSFSSITDVNDAFTRDLLEKAAANPAAQDADWARIGNAYKACMDEAAIEKAGLSGLESLFAEIDGAKNLKALMTVVGHLHRNGVDVFFNGSVDGDFKDPGLQILHLTQTGLGLPDRDYYFPKEDDTKGKDILAAYPAHIETMLTLAGKGGKKEAEAAFRVEMALAKAHKPRAELRDPTKTYNKLDRAGLKKTAPQLDWDGYLTAANAAHVQDINVEVPEVYAAMGAYLAKAPLADLKAYMKWALLRDTAGSLPKAFVDADFAFFGAKVKGTKEIAPRWKRCSRAVGGSMGEIVGRFYVEAKFGGNSKEIAQTMIGDIKEAFQAGLPQLAWMDEATRARAIEKKNSLVFKIGYPDKWEDYSSLTIVADNHLANSLAANRFAHDDQIGLASKPTDRSRWFMPPHLVNAYYHPLLNEMAFPAGILQPPFFDNDYPSALNYGAIGMVIGHELTHGYDDQGSQFDPKGQMSDWWTADARKRFEERTSCVSTHYGQYEPIPGVKVNGELTNGENIADIGGLRLAYRAWKTRYATEGRTAPSIEGLTDDQLFFVAFAQGWCTQSTDEYVKAQLASDPHSPAKVRVLGTVAQLPEFAEAFQCPAGSKMRAATACEIW